MSEVTVDRKSPPGELESPKRRLWHLVYLAIAIACLLCVRPAYHAWHDYRTNQYRTAAEAAAAIPDWDVIREVATRWTAWDSETVEGWLYLADASRMLNDFETAQAALAKVPRSDPRFLEARALRGDLLYLSLKRPYDAVQNWQEMLAIDPQADAARQGLISFYALSRQRRLMLEEIEAAMQRQCEPKEAYTYILLADVLNFTNGRARVLEWLGATPDDEHLQVALAYYTIHHSQTIRDGSAGERRDEHPALTEIARKFPKNLEVLAMQIDDAIENGQVDRVGELLRTLPASAEADNRFWRFKCWTQLQVGQPDSAIESGMRALDLHPFDWRARLLVAEGLRKLRRTDESARAAELAGIGKELERRLMELPNPLSLEGQLVEEIFNYSQAAGSVIVVNALKNRGMK